MWLVEITNRSWSSDRQTQTSSSSVSVSFISKFKWTLSVKKTTTTEYKWKEAKIHLSQHKTESILPMDSLCNLIISAGVKMLRVHI